MPRRRHAKQQKQSKPAVQSPDRLRSHQNIWIRQAARPIVTEEHRQNVSNRRKILRSVIAKVRRKQNRKVTYETD